MVLLEAFVPLVGVELLVRHHSLTGDTQIGIPGECRRRSDVRQQETCSYYDYSRMYPHQVFFASG